MAIPKLSAEQLAAARASATEARRVRAELKDQVKSQELTFMEALRKAQGDDTLSRIRALAIPPAYTQVWICASPRGHLQATGRDARGRKQYRYHPDWRPLRDANKFDRIVAFGRALPKLRRRVRADLSLPGLPDIRTRRAASDEDRGLLQPRHPQPLDAPRRGQADPSAPARR